MLGTRTQIKPPPEEDPHFVSPGAQCRRGGNHPASPAHGFQDVLITDAQKIWRRPNLCARGKRLGSGGSLCFAPSPGRRRKDKERGGEGASAREDRVSPNPLKKKKEEKKRKKEKITTRRRRRRKRDRERERENSGSEGMTRGRWHLHRVTNSNDPLRTLQSSSRGAS